MDVFGGSVNINGVHGKGVRQSARDSEVVDVIGDS